MNMQWNQAHTRSPPELLRCIHFNTSRNSSDPVGFPAGAVRTTRSKRPREGQWRVRACRNTGRPGALHGLADTGAGNGKLASVRTTTWRSKSTLYCVRSQDKPCTHRHGGHTTATVRSSSSQARAHFPDVATLRRRIRHAMGSIVCCTETREATHAHREVRSTTRDLSTLTTASRRLCNCSGLRGGMATGS